MAVEFGHSRRGARHYDYTMPSIAKSLESIAKSLEELLKGHKLLQEEENEVTLKALHSALDAVGGRSISLAEMIDDLEREVDTRKDVATRLVKAMDLSTAHVPSSDPDWGEDGLRVGSHAHGWILSVCDYSEVPEWLSPILEAAKDAGCTLINFDSAADTVDCFEKWEW